MARRRKALGGGAALCAALIGGLAWTFAQTGGATPVANLMPGNAVLYVGADGNALHKAAFEKTAAYDAIVQSGLLDTIKKAIERLQAQAAEKGVDQSLMGTVLKVVQHVMDHGLSLAVAIEPNASGGPPVAYAVFVLQDAAEFKDQIEGGLRAALDGQIELQTATKHNREVTSGVIPDTPGVDVGWWVEARSHLVLAVGINGVESALSVADGSAPNITSSALYKKYSAPKGFEQNAFAFIDFASLRKTFGAFPMPPLPDGRTVVVNDLLKAIGVDNLNSAVAQSGYKGRACWSEVTLDAPGPRKGVLALLDQPAFGLKDLPPLPPQLMNLAACSIDGAKTFDTITGIVKDVTQLIEPNQVAQITQGMSMAEQHLGFKLREDLFGTIGNVAVFFVDGSNLQTFNFNGIGVTVGVKDGDRLRSSLQKIFDIISQEARGEVVFEKASKLGRDMHIMKIRQAPVISPTLCIDKNWLHIGLMPQAIDASLLRTDGKLASWKPSADHTAAFAELPQSFTNLSMSDTQAFYRQLFTIAPLALTVADSAIRQNPDVDFELPIKPEDLPAAELVAQPLFPNISVGAVDSNGARQTSRTSLPGMDVGSATAVVAVGTALLLPAVQQARSAARRTQSANNLKQIGLALHNYHDVHNQFPQGLQPNAGLEEEERISWLVEILPYIEQAPLFNQAKMKEAWNSEGNRTVASAMIPTYRNPAVPPRAEDHPSTHYVGIAGVGEDAPKLKAGDPKAGIFGYDRVGAIRDITDGTSNTMMVAESDGRERPWAKGTASIQALTTQPYVGGEDGIGGTTPGGVNVLFADGSTRFISENTDAKVMEALATQAGGEVVGDF